MRTTNIARLILGERHIMLAGLLAVAVAAPCDELATQAGQMADRFAWCTGMDQWEVDAAKVTALEVVGEPSAARRTAA